MTLSLQLLTMLHMIAAGLYLGAAMDTYARLRQQPKWQVSLIVQDVLFWLLQGFFIFLWLKAVNEGEVRVTIFLAMLLGFATYKALLEPFYRRFLEAMISLFVHTVRYARACVHLFIWRPVVFVYRVLIMIFLFVGGMFWKMLWLLGQVLFFLSRPLRQPLQRAWQRWKQSSAESDLDQVENGQNEFNRKEGFWAWVKKWFRG